MVSWQGLVRLVRLDAQNYHVRFIETLERYGTESGFLVLENWAFFQHKNPAHGVVGDLLDFDVITGFQRIQYKNQRC